MLVHEFGHYYFAKRSGILVREFSIGMGPKVWWYKKNGTTYTIRILPLGGYVRMAGAADDDEDTLKPGTPVSLQVGDNDEVTMINASSKTTLFNGIPMQVADSDLVDDLYIEGYINGDESELKRYYVNHDATIVEQDGTEVRIAPRDVQFQSASLPHRMITNFAGPMNNFILAIIVFVVLGFMMPGIPTNSSTLGTVSSHSVAAKAGLKPGDTIKKVNSTKISNWNDLANQISNHPNKSLKLTIERNNHSKNVDVTPKAVKQGQTTVGQIGITEKLNTSIGARISYGWTQFATIVSLIFGVLGHMLTHGFNINDFGGPVAIYAGTSQATSLGIDGVLNFLAVLSINLGIVNLLPIPALDGGKLLLNIIEGIRRKPIPEKAEGIVTIIGFGLLMLLMILVTWNDIQRYFIK
ncbi:membrane-associated zinc metalloprotease [Paucilactobacillus suebicus DSM 5007 = KCTC 3549]|uniref:Zinc metalloprotease n=1 Tax=Paucilactobacillus suebicus DSM 5007 = KCTC 3549 TaxID=1423807 RepID=A0A0R1W3B7_9LACO|nr:membrane-associated zinc metalloprotease [Paucilactobacillus suebicus DSM 5007 = KCTC 3549]